MFALGKTKVKIEYFHRLCQTLLQPAQRNVCSSKEEQSDTACGNIGFKHWFRPEQTFYHSMHKIDLCEITKMPLKTQATAG